MIERQVVRFEFLSNRSVFCTTQMTWTSESSLQNLPLLSYIRPSHSWKTCKRSTMRSPRRFSNSVLSFYAKSQSCYMDLVPVFHCFLKETGILSFEQHTTQKSYIYSRVSNIHSSIFNISDTIISKHDFFDSDLRIFRIYGSERIRTDPNRIHGSDTHRSGWLTEILYTIEAWS